MTPLWASRRRHDGIVQTRHNRLQATATNAINVAVRYMTRSGYILVLRVPHTTPLTGPGQTVAGQVAMAHSPALRRGLVRDYHNPARVIVLVRGRIVAERKTLAGGANPCRDSSALIHSDYYATSMLLHILARVGWKILSIVLLSKSTLTHDFQLRVAGDWAKNNGSFVEERSNGINSS